MTKKAIGLAEYNDLTQDKQFDILYRDGVYVGKRKPGEQTIVLFQLHGFYVEVFYQQYRKLVDYIICSDNADILQPYLEQVQVIGLTTTSK